jgi:hypothetical protein
MSSSSANFLIDKYNSLMNVVSGDCMSVYIN